MAHNFRLVHVFFIYLFSPGSSHIRDLVKVNLRSMSVLKLSSVFQIININEKQGMVVWKGEI